MTHFPAVFRSMSLPLALGVVLGAGCSIDNNVERRTQTDVFLQEPNAEVDVLWVVDDSPSMAEEQALLAAGFESFIAGIEETNVDFHIGVISTDMDLTNPNRGVLVGEPAYLTAEDDYISLFQERVTVGTEGSDKEKGLSAAVHALTEPLASGPNLGFLRPMATLLLIFVSDEDDCSDGDALEGLDGGACYSQREELIPVKQFVTDFQNIKGPGARVVASSIVGPEVIDACDDSWPGHRYATIAEITGGVQGDICEVSYEELMADMGLAVGAEVRVFQLSYTPVEETLEVYVGEEEILEDPVNGWTYDSEFQNIRFDGDYYPPRGSSLSVTYEINNI